MGFEERQPNKDPKNSETNAGMGRGMSRKDPNDKQSNRFTLKG